MVGLADLVGAYVAEHVYGVSPGYVSQLRLSVELFGRFLGRPATLADLRDVVVSSWVDELVRRVAPATARTQRGNLLAIWRWAFESRRADEAPLRVRRVRIGRHCPRAWAPEELAAIFQAADALEGCFRGSTMRRALWWGSLVRCAYDTALRLGDLLRLRLEDVRRGQVVQHKTGEVVLFGLRPHTVKLVRRQDAVVGGDLIWPLWGRREALYRAMRQLVDQAGVRPGTFRQLRRSAVTALECVAPGAGTRLAGHAHRATTEAYYLDRSLLGGVVLPPAVEVDQLRLFTG
jgi:integrase